MGSARGLFGSARGLFGSARQLQGDTVTKSSVVVTGDQQARVWCLYKEYPADYAKCNAGKRTLEQMFVVTSFYSDKTKIEKKTCIKDTKNTKHDKYIHQTDILIYSGK